MDRLNKVLVPLNETAKETYEDEGDGLAFYRQIGPAGTILLVIFVILFFGAIGFGIFIVIKYFLREDGVNVNLKKRRLQIVIHAYVWSILLASFDMIFSDLSNFPTTDLPPNHAFHNWPFLVLYLPVYAKFHFIFLLNLHYSLIRHEKYSNWKVNYALENYQLYFSLVLAVVIIYAISFGFTNMQTPYLIFMAACVLIVLLMIALNLGDSSNLQFDAEQPKTKFKILIQIIHFVSAIISASALAFYSAQSINVRLFVMLLIFIEPILLTLSQYLINLEKPKGIAASAPEFHQEESI